MKKNKHNKKKRQQPTSKAKKQIPKAKKSVCTPIESKLQAFSKMSLNNMKDKDLIRKAVEEHVRVIEGYFKKYDSIQLLGSVGLYLIDNLPNLEKHFMSQYYGKKLKLDENAEVIAEYALNFGLAMPNVNKVNPTDDIVKDLRNRLKALFIFYTLLDIPLTEESMQSIDWLIHMNTISVRGDGYQGHVYEVFKEMFYPHSNFYKEQFGYSIEQLFDFFMELEDKIICKIGSQNSIYGMEKMHERWKKWEETNFGQLDDQNVLQNRDFSKGLFGDFFEANPDVPHSEDGNNFVFFQPDDYGGSNQIFWVYPQNDIEKRIMDSLSMKFGDNFHFLEDGEFKGSIMNGGSIFEKPFVKDGDKFYCFTPMIPHRNLFSIAEKLMRRNDAYYQKNFQQNTIPNSRDNYIERKVKSIMKSFLPEVKFYHSVHYNIIEDGVAKNPELDILGVSNKATYIIEVKAHELSYKDRVGLKGAKEKFKASVGEACKQCRRVFDYMQSSEKPTFGSVQGPIVIDKSKAIYKIAVTFQHYSSLLGQMDKLVDAGLMEERYRDIWIVSLFDLMVVSDFIESENEFISYLEMRKIINKNHSIFFDELDLLAKFLNHNLAEDVKMDKPMQIIGGAEEIDEEYAKDFYPEIGIRN